MAGRDGVIVALFYNGRRSWVGRVAGPFGRPPAISDYLRLLVSALKNGGRPAGWPHAGGGGNVDRC